MTRTCAILLAAGEAKRMNSDKIKHLHTVCGIPIIEHVLRAVAKAGADETAVVIGVRGEQLTQALEGRASFVTQNPANGWGTAKAVEAAADYIHDGPVFALLADMPLIRAEDLTRLREAVENGAAMAIVTARVPDPTGYGRILRDASGNITGIVEQKDATPEQQKINETNTGILCFNGHILREILPQIGSSNAKNEYYLTDSVELIAKNGGTIVTIESDSECGFGVNDRIQLSQAETAMRKRINRAHQLNGVTIIDPDRTYISPDVTIGRETILHPGITLSGRTSIGEYCEILGASRLENASVGNKTRIESSVLVNCTVGENTTVGPFAYLRPDTRVGNGCRIGDFVELKNASIGDLTHISHLSYVGDADLGKDINIGCGVVFSNYDGKNKYRSTVADHAFVGCNVNLVSPVSIGEGAYIAAGSTITKDVPSDALSIARQRQINRENWAKDRRESGKL